MKEHKSAMRKALVLASFAYGTFTAISAIAPILWQRLANKPQRERPK